jgi:hypothetical protein
VRAQYPDGWLKFSRKISDFGEILARAETGRGCGLLILEINGLFVPSETSQTLRPF